MMLACESDNLATDEYLFHHGSSLTLGTPV